MSPLGDLLHAPVEAVKVVQLAGKSLAHGISHPAKKKPPEKWNLWPRQGTPRFGGKEIWFHGWQSQQIPQGRVVETTAPNRHWPDAQKAKQRLARQARSGRGGRS